VTRIDERAADLHARYGDWLTLADLAPLLKYRSLAAIRKARLRGQLPVPVFQIAHRRGWFATPRDVAVFLETLGACTGEEAE
jgi:hypothetical protein